jgi:hypothetical protein
VTIDKTIRPEGEVENWVGSSPTELRPEQIICRPFRAGS